MRNLLSWLAIAFYASVAQINALVLCGLACGYALATYIYIRLLQYELAPSEIREQSDEIASGVRTEHWEPVVDAITVFDWEAVAASMPIVGWYFLAGFVIGGPTFVVIINVATAWQLFKLSSGAKQLVEDLGALPLGPTSALDTLQYLPEVVSQLAHEFNVRTPDLFILSDEEGMNAFVMALKNDQSILVVTKGLRHLNRNQLRGLIAHEMAHLAAGDTRHNMRMLALQLGVNSVRHSAEWMLRTGWGLLFGGSSNHRAALMTLQWGCLLVLFGIVLWPIGLISSLAGAVVMAWSNRRQELRADKFAAGILGSWEPIGDALKRIMGHNRRGRIMGPECRKLGHLMFSQATGSSGGILSSHPRMERRIKRADREWDGIPLYESDEAKPMSSSEMVDMGRVNATLENVSSANVSIFRDSTAMAVTIPALLLHECIDQDPVRESIEPRVREPVEMLCRILEGLSEQEQFALLELTLQTALKSDSKSVLAILEGVEKALPADSWTARCWLQVFRDSQAGSRSVRACLKDFRQCVDELAVVVSIGVGVGGGGTMTELRFQRVWMITGLELRTAMRLEELEFDDLVASVTHMTQLPARFREAVVQGLLDIYGERARLNGQQAAFLRYLTNAWSVKLADSVITMISRDMSEPQLRLRTV